MTVSFSVQYGRLTNINGIGDAKKNVGVNGRSSSSDLGLGLIKLSAAELTNFFGTPALIYLLQIISIFSEKQLEIFLDLCQSPVMTFFLYCMRILENQCGGTFLVF